MKTGFRILAALLLCGAGALGAWLYQQRSDTQMISREGVVTQIRQMNRLESTAFYIDTIIRTEKKGDWRKLWQDKENGLFIVRGKVLAGLDLDKLTAQNIHIVDDKILISLPPVEILSVDLKNIEVYDIQTGTFNLLPPDKSLFQSVQQQARRQVLDNACRADILGSANRQAQNQLENLFALTQTKVSVYPAAVPACRF
ncbi:DUF4230 domain-containing protein [Neisseria lisongii]|uniref:DUF4230 domain-containing protein n=1 Tax=Neisseria lisongii TaxID=2912188 RepID=A0AAW5AFP0_9NEIS|nr:DUF4230 domain-containing protein [Neisseria lisongii]MCF7530144.1 DUF4230 domain-containing protein [Neisseria lisongii]